MLIYFCLQLSMMSIIMSLDGLTYEVMSWWKLQYSV